MPVRDTSNKPSGEWGTGCQRSRGFQEAGVLSDVKCSRGQRNEAACLTQGQKGDWAQQDGGAGAALEEVQNGLCGYSFPTSPH